MTVEDVVGNYTCYRNTGEEEAREVITEHAPSLEGSGVEPVKVRLVAEALS